MPSKTPTNGQLTFRFKQHKTTILLLITPNQSFASVKEDLLTAIQATGITEINGNAIPSDPESIVLGVPIDKNDFDKGFIPLKIPEVEDGDDNAKGKGVKKGSVFNESFLGAGVKDGAVLAFKFDERDDEEWDVIMPSYEDEAASQGKS